MKARCIQESEISKAPPHVREIWDYFLRMASHKDNSFCKRGELITSYKIIIEDLSWLVGWRKMTYKKSQCENSMKWLKKHDMIATRKTTRGFFVSVCNYNTYQDPKAYESHKENPTYATGVLQPHDTIYKNDKNKEEKNKEEEKNKDIYSDLFESDPDIGEKEKPKKISKEMIDKIYQAYPRKVGSGTAKTAIAKTANKIAPENLLMIVQNYSRSIQWQDPQFIPNPATWFNQERWTDDPETWKEPKPKKLVRNYQDNGADFIDGLNQIEANSHLRNLNEVQNVRRKDTQRNTLQGNRLNLPFNGTINAD